MRPEDDGHPEDPLELHVTAEFLALSFADREAGIVRGLADYQRLFPGHEELVAREHTELLRDSAPPDEPGGTAAFALGRFRVEHALGRGGQGRVYRARDPHSGEVVALKILEFADGGNLGARLRIEREAEVLARLDHPGLVRVLALERERDVPFLVMELVEGEALDEHIARARSGLLDSAWPTAARLALVEALARALHTAHERGVLHRDVKPSNVVVRPDGTPVLVDFGLALVEGGPRLTRPGRHVGTLAYVPPERLRGDGGFDLRGDVYMLGALLFECLTLHAPFEAPTQLLLQEQILHREAPNVRRFDGRLPRALGAVVATALAKEPAERYVNALAFADDLARLRRGERVSLHARGVLARLAGLRRRRPRYALAAELLLGTTLAGALVTTGMERSTRRALTQVEHDGAVRATVQLEHEAAQADWPELPTSLAAMDDWLARAAVTRQHLVDGQPLEPRLASAERRLSAAIGAVHARRSEAAALPATTLEEPAARWRAACAEIAASPRYGGLALEPQLGLVPLGPDPATGLHEFAVPRTGHAPRRAADGTLRVDGESALVLVLLPGGSFWMGAQPPGAGPGSEPNLDPLATDDGEWPVHPATVVPFFLAKHEMTQGQWLRVTGENPSRWQPGSDAHDAITLGHPVENVSWTMAERTLRRIGLELPSEARWEYAARAGTTTPWSSGDAQESLHGHANLLDLAAVRAGGDYPHALALPGLSDGHVEHAPVGSFEPNAFGLFDVHGNVWEHCADVWRHYPGHPRAGSTPLLGTAPEPRVLRGGGYGNTSWHCRSSRRDFAGPSERTFSRGLRPARSLERSPTVSKLGEGR